jgi:hypothetical protein
VKSNRLFKLFPKKLDGFRPGRWDALGGLVRDVVHVSKSLRLQSPVIELYS